MVCADAGVFCIQRQIGLYCTLHCRGKKNHKKYRQGLSRMPQTLHAAKRDFLHSISMQRIHSSHRFAKMTAKISHMNAFTNHFLAIAVCFLFLSKIRIIFRHLATACTLSSLTLRPLPQALVETAPLGLFTFQGHYTAGNTQRSSSLQHPAAWLNVMHFCFVLGQEIILF